MQTDMETAQKHEDKCQDDISPTERVSPDSSDIRVKHVNK